MSKQLRVGDKVVCIQDNHLDHYEELIADNVYRVLAVDTQYPTVVRVDNGYRFRFYNQCRFEKVEG